MCSNLFGCGGGARWTCAAVVGVCSSATTIRTRFLLSDASLACFIVATGSPSLTGRNAAVRRLALHEGAGPPAARGRGLGLRPDMPHHCHACFRIWLFLEGGKTGGQLKRARIRRRNERFQRPPVRCLSPHSAGHTSRNAICGEGRTVLRLPPARNNDDRLSPIRRACRPVGRPQDRGTASTVGGHRRLPDTRCAPGSRESDGQSIAEIEGV